ncbi:MAG: M23 family metallopeptidase [Anaerolineae bacterium]|nr:M23 family metallopeptidase [Anaerolineae bacterium]
MSRSIAICPTSPFCRQNTIRERGRAASRGRLLLVSCIALAIWLGATFAASAEVAPPRELVLDFRPHAARDLEPDAGVDRVGPRAPEPSFRRSGAPVLTGVRVSPWPPRQGQTLSVHLQSRAPVTYTLTFGGRPYRAVAQGKAGAWSLVPVPPLTLPGYVPLSVQAGAETFTLNVPVFAGSFETVNIPAATAGPILSQQQKVAAETARMGKLFAGFTSGGWNPRSRFAPPLSGEFRHSSPFGSRRTYGNNPALSAHAGEDYAAPPGTPVYAPAAGIVVLAEPLFVRGNAVVLDHGHGVYTGYWHLNELDVAEGDEVTTGVLLGKVGSTGLSTGAHLHWEMRVGGMAVDPLQWAE